MRARSGPTVNSHAAAMTLSAATPIAIGRNRCSITASATPTSIENHSAVVMCTTALIPMSATASR
jgi:hypothetical protein